MGDFGVELLSPGAGCRGWSLLSLRLLGGQIALGPCLQQEEELGIMVAGAAGALSPLA